MLCVCVCVVRVTGWQQVWPLSPACDPAHLSGELPSCCRMATSPQPSGCTAAAQPNKQPHSKQGAALSQKAVGRVNALKVMTHIFDFHFFL